MVISCILAFAKYNLRIDSIGEGQLDFEEEEVGRLCEAKTPISFCRKMDAYCVCPASVHKVYRNDNKQNIYFIFKSVNFIIINS